MRRLLTLCTGLFLSSSGIGQTPVKLHSRACGFSQLLLDSVVYTWPAGDLAREYVKKICNTVGVTPNFSVTKANVDNALATVNSENDRVIYYSELFLASLLNESQKVALFAHEIGHHLNNHTFTKGQRRPSDELEADEFAGRILCKLGLNFKEAQALFESTCSTQNSDFYPARSARIESLWTGYSAETCAASTQNPIVTGRNVANHDSKPGAPSSDWYYQVLSDHDKKTHIPKAFSPNADGMNDAFKIIIPASFTLLELNIYNRWGLSLFSTTSRRASWDGTCDGKPCEADTYHYTLKMKNNKNAEISEQGSVVLIR